jgi:hypothetical protein
MKENRLSISSIKSGNVVEAGYTRRFANFSSNRFVGFKHNGTFFSDLKQLKSYFGVKNLNEVEFESDRLETGSVTAEFYDTEGEFFWGAYLWNGGFRVGTSADRLQLRAN